jgi:hypothetical protein
VSMQRYDEAPGAWRSFDEIVQLVQMMQNRQAPAIRVMRDILDRYDGDWVIPLPSVASEPVLPPLTPALIGEAIDTKARAAASVLPMVSCPAIDPLKDTGIRSREYAAIRRKIIHATYDKSRWKLGRRRFYRQLAAYETASLCVVPDFDFEMPSIEVRDPLGTFVEAQSYEQVRDPEYVAFVTRHSGSHLRKKFRVVQTGGAIRSVCSEHGGPITQQDEHELWDVVEWYDHDQFLWGLVGPVKTIGAHYNERGQSTPWMQLSPAFANKTGMLPAVIPHNVSLGRVVSRIGTLLGNVDIQAKLAALDIVAQEKAIFPDMYAIGQQNSIPMVVGGQWKDGREGDINLLTGVAELGMLRQTPDGRTSQTIDRQERNFRISTGLLPQFGGESFSALRTGRAMDSLMGASIDPIVQEMHEISEAYEPHLNSVILAMYKAYWPSKQYSMYSGWATDPGHLEFEPGKHIESTANTVSFAFAGADVVQTTQVIGSLRGAGLMSRRTALFTHPQVQDPEGEGRLIDEESLEQALKDSIAQRLMAGELDPLVAVKIRNHQQNGDDVFAAYEKANREIQALQATAAPPAPEGMVAPPEAMPGAMGAVQQPMPEPEPLVEVPGDVSRMKQLMQTMAG